MGTYAKENDVIMGITAALAWELPSKVDSKISKLLDRKSRSVMYPKIEALLESWVNSSQISSIFNDFLLRSTLIFVLFSIGSRIIIIDEFINLLIVSNSSRLAERNRGNGEGVAYTFILISLFCSFSFFFFFCLDSKRKLVSHSSSKRDVTCKWNPFFPRPATCKCAQKFSCGTCENNETERGRRLFDSGYVTHSLYFRDSYLNRDAVDTSGPSNIK